MYPLWKNLDLSFLEVGQVGLHFARIQVKTKPDQHDTTDQKSGTTGRKLVISLLYIMSTRDPL